MPILPTAHTLTRRLGLALLLFCLAGTLSGCINNSTTNASIDDPIRDTGEDRDNDTPDPGQDPVTPPPSGPISGLKLISSGSAHTCTTKNADDSLWCWGENGNGQLGIGSDQDSSSASTTNERGVWIDIANGENHSCAIKEDTSLWCWGDNSVGQLGVAGSPPSLNVPQPAGITNDWQSVAVGSDHSCGIKTDGSLWCWGSNARFQLGTLPSDAISESFLPVRIGAANDWTQLSLGSQFSCGIRTSGTEQDLYCWGDNTHGQLGADPAGASELQTPTPLSSANEWASVAAGTRHVCAISTLQDLYCWGHNASGQLGHGDTVDTHQHELQTIAPEVGIKWAAVSAGEDHTCAIQDEGSLWCWGNNATGQLGAGNTQHFASPIKINHSSAWLTLSAGDHYTCAIDSDYIGYCWGLNDSGQLGNGDLLDTGEARRYDNSDTWFRLDSGLLHTCGLKTNPNSPTLKTLWCGGGNGFGQLGIGSTANQASPVKIAGPTGLLQNWSDFSTGHYHSCAITATGALYCWGRNSEGQLGRGTSGGNLASHWSLQSRVSVGDDDWVKVVAGASHSCAIKGAARELYCWGDNSASQLGDNTTTDSPSPAQIWEDPTLAPASRVPFTALDVAVGGFYVDATTPAGAYTCAIRLDDPDDVQGSLWCWGKNDLGQLGTGDTTDRSVPVQITVDTTPVAIDPDFNTSWFRLEAGNGYTCGHNRTLKNATRVFCWGDNTSGQTGVNQTAALIDTPTALAGTDTWLDFDLGTESACAVNDENTLKCWGDNNFNQLTSLIGPTNTDDKNDRFSPLRASFANDWRQVAMGQRHGCGIREDGLGNRYAYCWGERAAFQLGNGSAWKTTPQQLPLE
mgnify:CR=1 FL=1